MADMFVFLKRFLSKPGRVGSVAPSSRFLTEEIMKRIPWQSTQHIVELGPGTGVFTRSILQKKRPDATFFVIERDLEFRQLLATRFPGIMIKNEAMHINHYLTEFGVDQVNVIVSGLPFAVFPADIRAAILDKVVDALAPGGIFITFQYSLQLRAELEQRFNHVDIGFTAFNIPPAFIYCCRK